MTQRDDELDTILSQAFTDGASDTMWQNDRHIEIFATTKTKLEALLNSRELAARIDELQGHRGIAIGGGLGGIVMDYEMVEARIAKLKAQTNGKGDSDARS